MNIKLDAGAKLPTKAYKTDAGYDLFSREDKTIMPGMSYVFDTGVHFQIPKGFCGMLKSKSGLMTKYDITSDGLVDEAYIGSVKVILFNNGLKPYKVCKGDKISQIVFVRYGNFVLEEVDGLEQTDRGENGFGSSGR